jgi:hypothetical protein
MLTREYAYLTDLRHQRADGDWKAVRSARVKSALETLAKVVMRQFAEPVRRGHGAIYV